MKKSFAFMRLFLPNNSEIKLREKEANLTDGKTETKTKNREGKQRKLVSPWFSHCAIHPVTGVPLQRCPKQG
jgi:hypothetical protein